MLSVFPSFPKSVPKALDPLSVCPSGPVPFIPGMFPGQSLAWSNSSPQVSPAGKELLLQVPVMGSWDKTKDRMDSE